MQSKTKALVLTENSTVSIAVMAIIFGLFTIGLETVFATSLKLPGHRALPGALALLLFAEAFAPMVLIGFAAAISSTLVLAGNSQPAVIGVWIVTAAIIFAMNKSPIARKTIYYVVGGFLFGLFTYLIKMKGIHHTPEMIRCAGHVGFGTAGGLISLGAAKVLGNKS